MQSAGSSFLSLITVAPLLTGLPAFRKAQNDAADIAIHMGYSFSSLVSLAASPNSHWFQDCHTIVFMTLPQHTSVDTFSSELILFGLCCPLLCGMHQIAIIPSSSLAQLLGILCPFLFRSYVWSKHSNLASKPTFVIKWTPSFAPPFLVFIHPLFCLSSVCCLVWFCVAGCSMCQAHCIEFTSARGNVLYKLIIFISLWMWYQIRV